MFVFNCEINTEEQLKYKKNEENKKKFKKLKKTKPIESIIEDEQISSVVHEFDVYRSVACKLCNTDVGVYDEKEEIYHFFNVLAGHS